MKVLVACEFSGIVREAFAKKGHDAMSCDLLSTEQPGNHYQGDVRDILDEGWDLMIAHPPCTFLANSGARWLYTKDEFGNRVIDLNRMYEVKMGADFFLELYNANIKRICIENPIQHKTARIMINKPYTQIVRPYQFGENSTKATCLWLKKLPKLHPTNIITPEKHTTKTGKVYDKWWFETCLISDLKERAKVRSKTFQGIAEAMAEQWG